MARSKARPSRIVDAVGDAVTRAEIAIVRTGRKAVAAVNRKVGRPGKITRGKTAAKKAAKKTASRVKRAARRIAKKTPKRRARR